MTRAVTLPRFYIFFAILACFIVSLTLVLPTFAEEATRSTTPRKEKVLQKAETRKDTLKDRMATREATLKTKLATFRDKNKATIAERVNTNLNKINEKQTQAMSNHLDGMSEILAKVETRKGSTSAIISAKVSIASATALVNIQAEKDYTITVTTEAKIKEDAKKMRDMLHSDLKTVRGAIITAKQAVAATIKEATNGQ